MQVEVDAPDSRTWISLKLYNSADEADSMGPNGNAICMTVMTAQFYGGRPLTSVFFRDEQVRWLMLWLAIHELDPMATVRAFVAAHARGTIIIHRTCPRSCKILVDLEPTAAGKCEPECAHFLATFTKSFPTICSPVTAFNLEV